MTDPDTLELRRIVSEEPTASGTPDTATMMRSGRRIKTRRRAIGVGVALATAAVVATPLLAWESGDVGRVDDATTPGSAAAPAATPLPSGDDRECGVLSCVDRPRHRIEETGAILAEVSVGTLASGAEEIVYVARQAGAGEWKGQSVEVVSAGYRIDGTVYRTAWALQPVPEMSNPDSPRFWAGPERINGRPGDNDDFPVLGYVDGNPDEITWSTTEGESGEVSGILHLDGYSAFYLTRPLPEDYTPRWPIKRNPDGSHSLITPDGPVRVPKDVPKTMDGMPADMNTSFEPDLTIHTSDGWSCALTDCGALGGG